MTPETAEMVVTSLYVGAGRRAGEAEMTLWANVLGDQPEEGVEQVVRKMLASVDFGLRPPTPALFIEYHTAWRRAHDPAPRSMALMPPISVDGTEQVNKLRSVLAATPPPVSRPSLPPPAEDRPLGVRASAPFCAADDHARCGAGPVRVLEEA